MKFTTLISRVAALLATSDVVSAAGITVDWTSVASVKSAASTIAYDLMTFYSGNTTCDYCIPGMLPGGATGYYWWEAGAMWGTLIDYWWITGDSTYNPQVMQALTFQVGENKDYNPQNQSKQMGNDDQGFWAMAAMTAAEYKFPDPPASQPQWLALVQAVFNDYVARWYLAENTCGGGLKWQVFSLNNGYYYKNSISNGCFFNIAARLAHYTGNMTYATWAAKVYDWEVSRKLISDNYYVYDGTDETINCTIQAPDEGAGQPAVNHLQYSYNPGIYLHGAAYMYSLNTTDQALWKTRVQGLYNGAVEIFADGTTGVIVEVACENQTPPNCNTDMLTFKGFLTRWMASSAKLAPFLQANVTTLLNTNAKAAIAQCSGGKNGRMCGFQWNKFAAWDGTTGAGQQMAALNVVTNTLAKDAGVVLTNKTGGTSQGNPNAGGGGSSSIETPRIITTGDRVGAGIMTTVILIGAIGGMWWMALE